MMWLAESWGVENVMPGGLEIATGKEHLFHDFGTFLSITAHPRPYSVPTAGEGDRAGDSTAQVGMAALACTSPEDP